MGNQGKGSEHYSITNESVLIQILLNKLRYLCKDYLLLWSPNLFTQPLD
jgi:hypothetical protein